MNTKYNPELHHSQSIRLRGYDYSCQGAYFITICVKNRELLFGYIVCWGDRSVAPVSPSMQLNEFDQIAYNEWIKSAEIRSEIELGPFVVMPNHIHGIVIIKNNGNRDYIDGRRCRGDRPVAPTNAPTSSDAPMTPDAPTNVAPTGPKPKSIGASIAGYKSSITKQINIMRKSPGEPVWQRNYYDHIIRDKKSFRSISAYIANNPVNWQEDKFYSE